MTTLPLCACGCGDTILDLGYERKYVARFRPGHNHRLPPGTPRWSEEDRGFTTPCWVWVGYNDATGYGPYRRYYEILVGPVPDGLHLDHLCRVRACINPAHLEPVSSSENARRAAVSRRAEDDAIAQSWRDTNPQVDAVVRTLDRKPRL